MTYVPTQIRLWARKDGYLDGKLQKLSSPISPISLRAPPLFTLPLTTLPFGLRAHLFTRIPVNFLIFYQNRDHSGSSTRMRTCGCYSFKKVSAAAATSFGHRASQRCLRI